MRRRVGVKICGLRDPENVALICAERPDFCGFVFARDSRRYVGEALTPELFEAASGIPRVAVFVDEPLGDLCSVIERYPFELLQLHGSEDPAYLEALRRQAGSNLRIIKSFNVSDSFEFAATSRYRECCDFYLFDAGVSPGTGGSGAPFDWRKLTDYDDSKPFFLAGGLDERNISVVPELIARGSKLAVLDFNSRLETAPGVKDPERVRRVLQEVRKWTIS